MVVYCKNHELCSRDQEALLQEPSGSLAGTMERCNWNHRALCQNCRNHGAMKQGALLQKLGFACRNHGFCSNNHKLCKRDKGAHSRKLWGTVAGTIGLFSKNQWGSVAGT
jgi:hypothetical protein